MVGMALLVSYLLSWSAKFETFVVIALFFVSLNLRELIFFLGSSFVTVVFVFYEVIFRKPKYIPSCLQKFSFDSLIKFSI